MRVQIIRTSDNYVLNVRYIDELLEDGTLADEADAIAAERTCRQGAIYYLRNADTYLRGV